MSWLIRQMLISALEIRSLCCNGWQHVVLGCNGLLGYVFCSMAWCGFESWICELLIRAYRAWAPTSQAFRAKVGQFVVSVCAFLRVLRHAWFLCLDVVTFNYVFNCVICGVGELVGGWWSIVWNMIVDLQQLEFSSCRTFLSVGARFFFWFVSSLAVWVGHPDRFAVFCRAMCGCT